MTIHSPENTVTPGMAADRRARLFAPYPTALLLMVLSALAWGSGTVMSKAVVDSVPPFTLLVIQLTASVVGLWTVTVFNGYQRGLRWRTVRQGWPGLLEPGLAYLLGLVGLHLTSASSASIIMATEPFMVLLLAVVLLRSSIRRWQALLTLTAFIGVFLITISSAEAAGSQQSIAGDVLILLGTFSAALYVVFSSRIVARVHPVLLTALQHSFGLVLALLLLPIGLVTGEHEILNRISLDQWGWAALSGIIQYSLPFLSYLMALRTLAVTQAAVILMLIPVFGIAGSVLFLGEHISLLQLGGCILILSMLLLLNRARWASQSPVSSTPH